MDSTELDDTRATAGAGPVTTTLRIVCSTLVAWPIVYRLTVSDGDAYLFLILVLVAPLAGLVLVANSLFHVARHRTWRSVGIGLLFVLVGAIGGGVAWHFLPQFRMH